MNSRLKKKKTDHSAEIGSRGEMIRRSLSHLNRSLRQFGEGLQSRIQTLQERLILEPLEGAAWSVSQRVRKVQSRVFDLIDARISEIEDVRHKKLDHQIALERFDDEGGVMHACGEGKSEDPSSQNHQTSLRH